MGRAHSVLWTMNQAKNSGRAKFRLSWGQSINRGSDGASPARTFHSLVRQVLQKRDWHTSSIHVALNPWRVHYSAFSQPAPGKLSGGREALS